MSLLCNAYRGVGGVLTMHKKVQLILRQSGAIILRLSIFGDSWEYYITVEKIIEPDAAQKQFAECLDGKYACPPEDCGGIGGYMDLLDIIKDPDHEEHESMLEWLGGNFNPDAFDIKKVNTYLIKLKWPRTTLDQLAKVLMDRDGYQG